MAQTVYFDCETYCATPIQHGTDRYTADAELILLSWAVDDGSAQLWDPSRGEPFPDEVLRLVDSDVVWYAHNAPFDRNVLQRAAGLYLDPSRVRCTRAQAYAHGLPGHLGVLGQVLGLPQDKAKLTDDAKLIHLFCVPINGRRVCPHERPEEWERFRRYAVRDTEALREIHRRLPVHNYQGRNLDVWVLNQRVNERGFGFDVELARGAVELLKRSKERHDSDIAAATAGCATAATQRDRLFKWLSQRLGDKLASLRAADIRECLDATDLDPATRFVLQTRLEAAKSSGAKYRRGLEQLGERERMRHTMQFSGAGRTGRESHKGFQPGNMARPVIGTAAGNVPVKAAFIDDVILPAVRSGAALHLPELYGGPNTASMLALRHVIVAGPGNVLIVGDWSNIESRVLAWLADEAWELAAYRKIDAGEGVDVYKLLASQTLRIAPEDVNDNLRQAFKVVKLSMGYGGGVGAFAPMAATYNIDLETLPPLVLPHASAEQLKRAERAYRRALLEGEDFGLEPEVFKTCDVLKQSFRASNKATDALKYEIDAAVKEAIRNPQTLVRAARCALYSTGRCLIIQLPNGDRLYYWEPQVHTERVADPDTGKPIVREWTSFCAARGQNWWRERAWAGVYLENIDQAISNRILRAGLLRVDSWAKAQPDIRAYLQTLPPQEQTAIVLDVHDEIVCEVPEGTMTHQQLCALLVESESWYRGLPLAAAGWSGPRYGKR